MTNSISKPENRGLEKKIATLHAAFQQRLPEKTNEIKYTWANILANNSAVPLFAELHRRAHNIAGLAGTYAAVIITIITTTFTL